MNKRPVAQDAEHEQLWSDHLQDWLDGDIAGTDAATVAAHLADCQICLLQLAGFKRLDAVLRAAAPAQSLDADFDARLFSRIDALDDSSRADARQRIEQERLEDLQALSHRWHESLAYLIPGVIAGMALAFALVGCLESLGVGRLLAQESTREFGHQAGFYAHMLLTAIVGAGIGFAVASWLSPAAE